MPTAHLSSGLLAAFVGLPSTSQSLGLGRLRIFRRIVLPQAISAIVPASGSLLIGMLLRHRQGLADRQGHQRRGERPPVWGPDDPGRAKGFTAT